MAKEKSTLPVLTRKELEAARIACSACVTAAKVAAAAEKDKAGALAQIFFKMGFPMDEVKAMDPMTLAKSIERRLGKTFDVERDALGEFAVMKTSEGRYPRWKQEFISANGPAMAAEIEGATATQYSYTVIDAEAAKPGAGGVIVLAAEAAKKRSA